MFLLSGQYDSAYHYSRQGSLVPNIYTRANSYKQLCEVALETKNGALYEECVNSFEFLLMILLKKLIVPSQWERQNINMIWSRFFIPRKLDIIVEIAVVIIGALLILFLYIQKRRSRDKAWKAQVEALRQKMRNGSRVR